MESIFMMRDDVKRIERRRIEMRIRSSSPSF
jgi:hypothetical protein